MIGVLLASTAVLEFAPNWMHRNTARLLTLKPEWQHQDQTLGPDMKVNKGKGKAKRKRATDVSAKAVQLAADEAGDELMGEMEDIHGVDRLDAKWAHEREKKLQKRAEGNSRLDLNSFEAELASDVNGDDARLPQVEAAQRAIEDAIARCA